MFVHFLTLNVASEATHELAAAKEAENDKMMRALGIRREDYREGMAFDQDYQAEKAAQRKEDGEKRKQLQTEIENARKRAAERLREIQAKSDRERVEAAEGGRSRVCVVTYSLKRTLR